MMKKYENFKSKVLETIGNIPISSKTIAMQLDLAYFHKSSYCYSFQKEVNLAIAELVVEKKIKEILMNKITHFDKCE